MVQTEVSKDVCCSYSVQPENRQILTNKESAVNKSKEEQNEDAEVNCIHISSGEALEQVSQVNHGCPIPGHVQGRVGWALSNLI